SNVLGSDGRLYDIGNAPADLQFLGVGQGFIRKNEHWGVTQAWMNPFGKGAVSTRFEQGYTVGRDAGKLILSTPTSIFEGTIKAGVVTGNRQTDARPAGVTDGYKLTQDAAARAGILALGQYTANGLANGYATEVVFGKDEPSITGSLSPSDALPAD